MIDFVERKLVISDNKPDDGWTGTKPRPKYWMAAHHYAWDYVTHFNKQAELWNKKNATHYIRASTLSLNWYMNVDLSELNAWGQYCPAASTSWQAIIKIDIYAHLDCWHQTKHTIRHEITHAIDHQIMGNEWLDHCECWKKIARLHNVKTDYTHEGVHKSKIA